MDFIEPTIQARLPIIRDVCTSMSRKYVHTHVRRIQQISRLVNNRVCFTILWIVDLSCVMMILLIRIYTLRVRSEFRVKNKKPSSILGIASLLTLQECIYRQTERRLKSLPLNRNLSRSEIALDGQAWSGSILLDYYSWIKSSQIAMQDSLKK